MAKNESFLAKCWRITKRTFLFLFIFHIIYLVALKWVDPPITITQLVSFVTGHGLKRDMVDAKEISSFAKLAVIASEDQLFADHNGFDWKSIEKAMKYNQKKPGRIRGGSTISQQVAKNVFLWQGRDYVRKGLEMYFTFMIELIWGKQRILEVYLNVIEMGDGIFGIQAASKAYFNKDARSISKNEAAMIAACLPSPKKYTVKPACNYVRGRYPTIVRQMNNLQGDEDIQKLLQ